VKRLTSTQKWFSPLLIGVLLILALLQLAACDNPNNPNNPNNPGGGSSPNTLNLNSGGGGPSINNDTWIVTINSITSPTSYNGYTPSAGNHFLIVDASFTNTSSGTQILGSGLFVFKDSNGQQYSEDQASNPGQTFTVDPNQNIETQTAYVVPDSECNFTLTFVGNSNSDGLQWTVTC
jgi:Domain of unknown function (DUF4352)